MNKRNYNKENKDIQERKYTYDFDSEVMHKYFLKAMLPWFKDGNVLELGSNDGLFTKRLEEKFDNITCIEASSDAVSKAKSIVSKKTKIINSTFEEIKLDNKYNNIIMTHVLEHLDNPVQVLKKIHDNWLEQNGVFIVICPNANAASRQIAVHMDIVTHNSAITEGEKKHGHMITYSLDTLLRDVKQAGFEIIHSGGIFFKALSNFQWDMLLNTNIINQAYLDGCYKLGQKYPDLCSSIFLVCKI